MSHQATLRFSESLLRQAVLAFWRRSVGIGFFLIVAIVVICLAALLYSGDRSWVVGVLAMGSTIGVAFPAAVYLVHLRNSLQKLRDMGAPQATFLAEESSFTLTSGIGSSTLAWSTIAEVWRFPTFWLLLFSKAQFVTVPLVDLPLEMQDFVLQRVAASGGKIRNF